MHQIVATINGERKVLEETEFCESVFDYFCYYLREYAWNDLTIEGDCNEEY